MTSPHSFRISSFRSPSRWGLTSVELLVVIAIIGVLAAILLVALGKAKDASKLAVCTSNLHQIGVGFRLYAIDHKGQLPPVVDTAINPGKSWTKGGWYPQLMAPYVSDQATWNCPAQPKERWLGNQGPWKAGKSWYVPSYAINSVLAGQLMIKAIDHVTNGNNQILLTEGAGTFWNGVSISAAQTYVQASHDGPHTNVFLFADMRVEPGAKSDMVAYGAGDGSGQVVITLNKYKP